LAGYQAEAGIKLRGEVLSLSMLTELVELVELAGGEVPAFTKN
jgi:hypothetical protein